MGRSLPLMSIFVHFSLQFKWYKLKKRRWCAWYSNPWLPDGRRRRYHGAMAAAAKTTFVDCLLNIGSWVRIPEPQYWHKIAADICEAHCYDDENYFFPVASFYFWLYFFLVTFSVNRPELFYWFGNWMFQLLLMLMLTNLRVSCEVDGNLVWSFETWSQFQTGISEWSN